MKSILTMLVLVLAFNANAASSVNLTLGVTASTICLIGPIFAQGGCSQEVLQYNKEAVLSYLQKDYSPEIQMAINDLKYQNASLRHLSDDAVAVQMLNDINQALAAK